MQGIIMSGKMLFSIYSLIISCFILAQSNSVMGEEKRYKLGKIVKIKGLVKVYRFPNPNFKEAEAESKKKKVPLVLYEKQYWQAYEVKKRVNLYDKDMIVTGDGQIIAIINRKKVTVSPFSYFSVNRTKAEGGKSDAFLTLVAGKVRASIDKNKKNETVNLRTKSAVMGVRGTDLFISYSGNTTEVATLEGLVDVTNHKGDKKSTVSLKQGQASKIRDPYTEKEKENMKKKYSPSELKKLLAAAQPSKAKKISPTLMKQIQSNSKGMIEDDHILKNLEVLIRKDRIIEEK